MKPLKFRVSVSFEHASFCDMDEDCMCGVGLLEEAQKRGKTVVQVTSGRPWVVCDGGCQDLYCVLHQEHAFECDCPAVGDDEEVCVAKVGGEIVMVPWPISRSGIDG